MSLRLVLRNLRHHPLRSGLTFASVVVAVFLLCFLRATVTSLTTAVDAASASRLVVQSAVSLFVDLPINYQQKIAAVEGVESVCKWQWFGGIYRDRSGYFAQFGVEPEAFASTYPEIEVVDGTWEGFLLRRDACLVGADLAEKYGWKVGDSVPLLGTIFPKTDGSAWDFHLAAIYRSRASTVDQATMFFHYDYLSESLESGVAQGPVGVGVYVLKLAPGASPTAVMADVDLLFENGPQRVQTTTEAEFSRQFVSMLGNVPALLGAIGGAVLFAIFFAALNTMLMAARERLRDVGVLKALGFTDRSIMLGFVAESLSLCGGGGLVGTVLAKLVEPVAARALSAQLQAFALDPGVVALALGLALGVGLVAGLVPGWHVARHSPVAALRAEA